jgi:SRSO17 transposase
MRRDLWHDGLNHDKQNIAPEVLPMTILTSFARLVQPWAQAMTAPTFENLLVILTGWILAPHRTVTRMLQAVGMAGERHHSAFHRLFAQARWSTDRLGLLLFDLIHARIPNGESVLLVVDDTLTRKRGLKMFGTGMHYDPQLSSRNKSVTHWGHSWVVIGVVMRFPLWPDRPMCLPILFRLYLNKDKAKKHRRVYRSRPELALEMLRKLAQSRPQAHLHLLGDSAYGGQGMLNALPKNCELTSRLVVNARLHAAPPKRRAGQNGRPRVRGDKLPTPHEMLSKRCRRTTVAMYGRNQQMRIAETEARVYAAPQRPLRIVVTEALQGGRGIEAFYSTCHDATAEQVLTWYAMRWSVEVTFHDCKQHLGFAEPQGWSRRAVERTAPMALWIYSLVVLWFAHEGHQQERPLCAPWYRNREHASFADMLATLRQAHVRQQVSEWGLEGPGVEKLQQALENALALAA